MEGSLVLVTPSPDINVTRNYSPANNSVTVSRARSQRVETRIWMVKVELSEATPNDFDMAEMMGEASSAAFAAVEKAKRWWD